MGGRRGGYFGDGGEFIILPYLADEQIVGIGLGLRIRGGLVNGNGTCFVPEQRQEALFASLATALPVRGVPMTMPLCFHCAQPEFP